MRKVVTVLFLMILLGGAEIGTAQHALSELSGDPILIVGVVHRPGDNELTDESSNRIISQLVLPALRKDRFPREKTVLLREGRFTARNKGNEIYGNDVGVMEHYGLMPPGSREEIGRYHRLDFRTPEERFYTEYKRTLECIRLANGDPVTVSELDSLKNFDYEILHPCTHPQFYEILREYSDNNRRLEQYYAWLATELVRRGFRVVIIVGNLHAWRMTRLLPDFVADSILTIESPVQTTAAIQFAALSVAIDGIVMDHYRLDSRRYSEWKDFHFHLSELPHMLRPRLANRGVRLEKEQLEGLKLQDHLAGNEAVYLVPNDMFRTNGAPVKKGASIELLFEESQSEVPGRYLFSQDLSQKDQVRLQFNIDNDVRFQYTMDAAYVALADNLPPILTISRARVVP